MKTYRIIIQLLSVFGLSACVLAPQPITTDYGEYPANYEQIVKQFYQGKEDSNPIDYIVSFAPVQYEQNVNNYGFRIPYNSKIWLNAGTHQGQVVKGYLVCALETNHFDGYKTDALLLHNGKVISVVYNVRIANAFSAGEKLCHQQDNWLLGTLTKIRNEHALQFIDNFIKQTKREQRGR